MEEELQLPSLFIFPSFFHCLSTLHLHISLSPLTSSSSFFHPPIVSSMSFFTSRSFLTYIFSFSLQLFSFTSLPLHPLYLCPQFSILYLSTLPLHLPPSPFQLPFFTPPPFLFFMDGRCRGIAHPSFFPCLSTSSFLPSSRTLYLSFIDGK